MATFPPPSFSPHPYMYICSPFGSKLQISWPFTSKMSACISHLLYNYTTSIKFGKFNIGTILPIFNIAHIQISPSIPIMSFTAKNFLIKYSIYALDVMSLWLPLICKVPQPFFLSSKLSWFCRAPTLVNFYAICTSQAKRLLFEHKNRKLC